MNSRLDTEPSQVALQFIATWSFNDKQMKSMSYIKNNYAITPPPHPRAQLMIGIVLDKIAVMLDQVDSYFLFSNPHQYGKSIDVRFTPIRVVCHNTLTMSLEASADRSVKVGHRTVFDPDQVKSDLGLAHEKFEKYKEMAQFLGSKRFSVENLIKFYDEVYPSTSRTAEKVAATTYEGLSRSAQMCYDALETQPGAQYGEGSWWQAFNSVTYVTDHLQGRSAEQRLHNQWFFSMVGNDYSYVASVVGIDHSGSYTYMFLGCQPAAGCHSCVTRERACHWLHYRYM